MTNTARVHSASNGIFIKTASPQIVELLEGSGLDFAVIDTEHAPFDQRDVDIMMVAGKAARLPLYVRVRDHSPAGIQSALDLGACGVVIPRVDSSEVARQVVRAARFMGGTRGFSGGTRHAHYGSAVMGDAISSGDAVRVIVQIEHPNALRDASAILATAGVDGILIGRADLAVALGYKRQGAEVDLAVTDMLKALLIPAGKIVGMVVSSAAELATFQALGANWFLVGTDHGLLRKGIRDLLLTFGSSETQLSRRDGSA